MGTDPSTLALSEIANALRSGNLSATELTEHWIGAQLVRQRRLRRIDLPPFRYRALRLRFESLGDREPFAKRRHLPVARRANRKRTV